MLYVIGNMKDLPRVVPAEEVRAFCSKYRLLYFEVSAKDDTDGTEIRAVFEVALRKINGIPPDREGDVKEERD